MPISRTETHFNVAVDHEEMLDRRSLIVLCYLESACTRNCLYSTKEIVVLLRKTDVTVELKSKGYGAIDLRGRGVTSVPFIMNNLYRNRLINKIAADIFWTGRPVGVTWEIPNARQDL